MRFDFATATRILFAPGSVNELPGIAREYGTQALIVTGGNGSRAAATLEGFENVGIRCSTFAVSGEPTLEIVRQGVKAARESNFVVGIGGGSAMDAAKAIAALVPNSGEPLDYLEVIGAARPLETVPLPFIAVPTTAGTGAEVTRNAVLGSPEHGMKASLRSPFMLAKLALIDPNLTVDLPQSVTASTGLDTLTQLIEPYVSARANPFTDPFCIEGMKRVKASLKSAFHDGQDRTARESMSFASLLSGLSLANAGLGVVHGFASPLGGMLDAPHGALCASVLPHGVRVNVSALRERAPEHEALRKYHEVARILTGNSRAEAEDCATWTAELCHEFSIPSLRTYGLKREQIPQLVENAAKASSMKANPIPLRIEEITEVAESAF
jgi:alcohol dehydrogenase class IV